ncbi:hypothetical protein [Vibrio aestuarianus]|uniref:Uncharacterized protein n=3 Tax=Vibrio aestuarianus TaxID=28171 RepID=A0ABN8TSN6_9VIBR|nr:hypothetical protein [Vibrio aestuarianus]MDE1214164.1 hypothetical protein [Vibrio aestuarianus]MDE1216194.1 hypothetical protein [Vibrio aestuarianus]MDE1227485.1 hypothetical protein [Vibrio aestuarianus]MDE1255967.1 hypothetical protein [Vibrio aestuarianus]MDE1261149.1 hypothetical protein [Vibrio aestuarianus]
MNIFKIIFLASVISFSSLSFSAGENKIYSSSFLQGSVKAFYINFTIRVKNTDNGPWGQELYGTVNIKEINGQEVNLQVWKRTASNPTGATLDLRVEPNYPFMTSDSRDSYITLSGSIWDDDLAGQQNDRLCNLKEDVRLYQSQVGERIYNAFERGLGECDYLEITKFEFAQ